MRIGVVSDTHDNLGNVSRIVELFNRANVERVIHTGDITRPTTLEVFARLDAPLHAVFGNNDVERDALANAASRLGIEIVEPPLRLSWHEREITVVHHPEEHGEHEEVAASEILLHGHDHRRRIDRLGERLIFNPGECAGMIEGYNSVGVLDLGSLGADLLEF